MTNKFAVPTGCGSTSVTLLPSLTLVFNALQKHLLYGTKVAISQAQNSNGYTILDPEFAIFAHGKLASIGCAVG